MKTNDCCWTHKTQEALLFENNKKIQHEAHEILLFENNKKTQLKSWLKIHEHKESDYVTWYNKIFFLIISDLKRNTVTELDLLTAWDFDRTLDLYLNYDQNQSHEYDLMMWILKAFLEQSRKSYLNVSIRLFCELFFNNWMIQIFFFICWLTSLLAIKEFFLLFKIILFFS